MGAQEGTIEAVVPRPSLPFVQRIDRLLEAGRFEEALDRLEMRLVADSTDFQARWRAAQASVALGVIAQGTEIENRWYRRGIAHAEVALRQRPEDRDAMRWAIASKGNLALQTGAREAADLAEDVWDLGYRLIEFEPGDALAHNALGTLHYEVMKLSGFERFLGRLFLGGEVLGRANWEDALMHHERAVELAPEHVLYRVALAKTLAERDRPGEAVAHLERAVRLPTPTRVEEDFMGRARSLFEELRERAEEEGSASQTDPDAEL